MAFFENDAVNRTTAHSALQSLAQSLGGLFVFVFLLKAGVPTPLVLCTLAAMTMGRFLMRPLVLAAARRGGLRTTLMIGVVLEAALFPLLPLVHGPGPLLLAVILVGAFGSVFYWTSLHAYVATVGDVERRGRQIGARAAAGALMSALGPVIGGLGLTAFGGGATFALAAAAQLAALLPLIGGPNPQVPADLQKAGLGARLAVVLQASDGWFQAGFTYVWQIALFIALGERFAAYGGAMAVAGLVGAAGSLVVGRLVDLGHGRVSVALAYTTCAVVVILKAASLGAPALAVAAGALATVAGVLLDTVMMSRVYNLAKASPCPLRFHMATEGGWDVGCAGGCLSAAALLGLHAPLSAGILLALGGAALGVLLLLRSYARLSPAPA